MILRDLVLAGGVTVAAAPILAAMRRAPARVRHAAFAAALAASAAAPFAGGLVPPRIVERAPAVPVLSRPPESLHNVVSPLFSAPVEGKPAAPPLRIPEGAILLPALIPLGRMLLGWRTARRWVRASTPGPDGALLSPDAPVPMTFFDGLRHRILLPREAADWPESRLRIVMLHERAHIERGDWWTQTAARVVVALQWMNPLAWWMLRGLRDAAEEAADQTALRRGVPPGLYAKELLTLGLPGPRPLGTLPMTPKTEIGRRVVAVLKGPRPAPAWAVALAVAAPLALLVPAAALAQGKVVRSGDGALRREADERGFGDASNDWTAEVPGLGEAHLEYVVGWAKGEPLAWKPNGDLLPLAGLPVAPVPPSPEYVRDPKTKRYAKSSRPTSGETMFVVRFEDPTGVMEGGTQSALIFSNGPRYAVFGRGSWTTNPGKPGTRYTAGFKGYPKGYAPLNGPATYLDAIGFAVGPVDAQRIFEYDVAKGQSMDPFPPFPDFQQDGFSFQGDKRLELIVRMKKVSADPMKRPWLVAVAYGKDGRVDTQGPILSYEGPKSFALPFYRYSLPRPRSAYRRIEILAGATAITEFRDVAILPKGALQPAGPRARG